MLKNTRPTAAIMFVAASAVIANAAAINQFCIVHPLSVSCEDAIAPGPEFPHESPEAPESLMGSNLTATSSTGGVHALRAESLVVGSPEIGTPRLTVR